MAGRLLLPITWVVVMAAGAEGAAPPPDLQVIFSDALVIVNISSRQSMFNVILRKNGSSEEKSLVTNVRNYIIPPNELSPEQTYCVKVRVRDSLILTPFSREECFTAPSKAPPNNLRVEELDSRYLLKWDWDLDQSPNVTFSVDWCQNLSGRDRCVKIKGCENITATQCRTALSFKGIHILRVSVYDGRREEKSSSVLQFTPYYDTVIGPPKDFMMRIVDNELFFNVSAPDVFRNPDIYGLCDWLTHLEYWTNSSHSSEVSVKEEKRTYFKIDSLEDSTTYCAKAKMKCEDHDRSSMYSQVYCITTDPRSYMVEWIIGCTIFGVVVLSVLLYISFCPLKRYIKHTFFPSSRLPSCIEQGFGESSVDCTKRPFLQPEEETTDRCSVVHKSHNEDLVQINSKSSSQASSQDSGNYSDEGQSTAEAETCGQ